MINSPPSPAPARLRPARLRPRVLLVAAVVSFGLAQLPEMVPGFVQSAAAGPVIATQQFRRAVDGSFEVTAVNREGKHLVRKLTLARNTEYRIRFDITRISGTGMVVVDFIAAHYDNNEQEFHLNVSSADAPMHVDRVVNSGEAPPEAHLRIFSYDPIRFTVRNVEVTREGNPLLHIVRGILLSLALLSGLALIIQSCRTCAGGLVTNLSRLREEIFHSGWAWGAGILMVTLTGLAVTVRNLALSHPFVFGDEGVCVILAKYLGRWDLLSGNHLVFKIPCTLFFASIHWVFQLGANYVVGARLVNVLWFCTGLLLIYGTARRLMQPHWALLALAGIGAGPISIYTACVMPETMYFCMICGLFFVFVRYVPEQPLVAAALTGAMLGAASLVKPHALLLVLPAILAIVLLKASVPEWSSWKICALQVLIVLVSIYAAQRILGFAATGKAGFELGATYGREVGRSIHVSPWILVLSVFAGHLAMLLSLYAAPLVVIAMGLWRRALVEEPTAAVVRLRGLLLLLTCCLCTLLLTTTKYGVSIGGRSMFEAANRLHGRYYFFLLPFLVVSFFAAATRLDWSRPRVRAIFAVACGAMGVLTVLSLLLLDHRYFMYFIDYPDVFWFVKENRGRLVFPLLCTVFPLCVYAFRRSCPPVWFGAGYLLVSLTGTVCMSRYMLALPPTDADGASALFRNLIPEAEWDSGLVIVTESGDVEPYRLLFHIPAAYKLILDPVSSVIPASAVADDRTWVLISSDRPVRFSYGQSFVRGRYHLYLRQPVQAAPVQTAQTAPAAASANACAVDHLVGFHNREGWGVWSAQDPAEISLQRPVSGKIRLRLVAYGQAKNPSQTLQIGIGDSVKSITLPTEPRPFDLDYNLHSASRTITFRGVTPRTPKSLGVAEDIRPLGVAMVNLECSQQP